MFSREEGSLLTYSITNWGGQPHTRDQRDTITVVWLVLGRVRNESASADRIRRTEV